jgi:hypothetical protein
LIEALVDMQRATQASCHPFASPREARRQQAWGISGSALCWSFGELFGVKMTAAAFCGVN